MAKILGLPKLSPTMEEGTLVQWSKKEGDSVDVDDLLAEVETDKATMEFRSFDKGTLLKLLVDEGTTLAPDQPVAILGQEGEDIQELLDQVKGSSSKSESSAGEQKESDPREEQESAKTPDSGSQRVGGENLPEGAEQAEHEGAAESPSDRVLASPLVRKLAREQGIDLGSLAGSGPKGRIIKRDLDGAESSSTRAQQSQQVPRQTQEDRDEPLSSMRRTIARRLTESKQQVPHFYLSAKLDAGLLWKARQEINAKLKESGEKISLNDFVVKACAIALRRVPQANASFLGKVIRYYGRIDISVAVAIPDGLVTPVVRHADQKGVLEISREIKDLAQRAKNKKLKPEEMQDGTFSVSNLGMYGIDNFSAVINPPEGAILAVGAVTEEAVMLPSGEVGKGRRMQVTLSCDHRVVDGAVGAAWLREFRTLIEQPLSMLL